MIWSGHKFDFSKSWFSSVTLIQYSWLMGPRSYLTEMKVWPKIDEIPSKGLGNTKNMKGTWNQICKLLTFKCDFCLAWLAHKFCILPYSVTEVNIWPNLAVNPSKNLGEMEQQKNQRFTLLTFKSDLDLDPAWLARGFCMLPNTVNNWPTLNEYHSKG